MKIPNYPDSTVKLAQNFLNLLDQVQHDPLLPKICKLDRWPRPIPISLILFYEFDYNLNSDSSLERPKEITSVIDELKLRTREFTSHSEKQSVEEKLTPELYQRFLPFHFLDKLEYDQEQWIVFSRFLSVKKNSKKVYDSIILVAASEVDLSR